MTMKKRYEYYIVEGTYLVRWGTKGCEYLKPDGTWHEYSDMWDVTTNGRLIGLRWRRSASNIRTELTGTKKFSLIHYYRYELFK